MQSSVADEQEADDATNQLTDSIADSDDEDCDESQVSSSSGHFPVPPAHTHSNFSQSVLIDIPVLPFL